MLLSRLKPLIKRRKLPLTPLHISASASTEAEEIIPPVKPMKPLKGMSIAEWTIISRLVAMPAMRLTPKVISPFMNLPTGETEPSPRLQLLLN